MEPMEYIALNSNCLAIEHICCALSDKKGECGVADKKAWLSTRFQEGLRFVKGDVRGKVFIEYLPAEAAWVPVEAKGWMFINCLWVSGLYAGKGHGRALLERCEKDAALSRGLVAISSAKKRPFLADKDFLVAHGFLKVDEAPPYFELLAKPFSSKSPMPTFSAGARAAHLPKVSAEWEIFYTAQCPFAPQYAARLKKLAEASGRSLALHRIEAKDAARKHCVAATTFSLFRDGHFLTHEIPSETKFAQMLVS